MTQWYVSNEKTLHKSSLVLMLKDIQAIYITDIL